MLVAAGLLAPFRGVLFVLRHRLLRYLVAPLLLSMGSAGGLAYVVTRSLAARVAGFGQAWPMLAGAAGVLVFLVLFALAFLILQPLWSAPFVDALTERVETLARGDAPQQPFWRSLGRSLLEAAYKAVAYALVVVLGWVAALVTGGPGALIAAPLLATFVVYDAFDYPLARRGLGFRAKWAYLFGRPDLLVGFGFGTTVLFLVPLALVFVPAMTAVGATLVVVDRERRSGGSEGASNDAAQEAEKDTPRLESPPQARRLARLDTLARTP